MPSIKAKAQPLDLTETGREELALYICKELDRAEEERAELEKKWLIWLDQYNGRLKRDDNASDWQAKIDVPTTRERAVQALARMVNPIIQEDRLFVARERIPDLSEFRKAAEDFLDYQTDQWDVEALIYALGKKAQIYKYGVLCDDWVCEYDTAKTWITETQQVPQVDEFGETLVDEMGQPIMGEQEVLTEKEYGRIVRQGVFPRVPACEDIFFRAGTTDPQTAPWISERFFYTEHEAKSKFVGGEWEGSIDKLRKHPETPGVRQKEQERLGVEYGETGPYQVHRWFGFYDVDGSGQDSDIVVEIDRNTKTILSHGYNHRHSYRRPYLFWQWEEGDDITGGDSLCQILEPIHRAISAYTVQRIEAASLANGVALGTTDQEFASKFKGGKRIAPGEVHLFTSKDDVWEIKLSQPFSELSSLVQELNMHADKLVGLNDYSFGVEQVSRPTASGQVALIEEGKQPLYQKLNSLRKFIGQLGLRILARYRQHWPEGVPYYRMVSDGQFEMMLLQFPEGFIEDQVIIEPKASSANLNENVRKQETLALLEQMKGYYQMLMPLLMQAAMPGPGMMVSLKEAMAMREMMNRVLDEFKIPRPEEINPDFTQEVMGGLQMAMAQMQLPQMGPGQAPGGGQPGQQGSGPPPQK